jgi:hypothetical protein
LDLGDRAQLSEEFLSTLKLRGILSLAQASTDMNFITRTEIWKSHEDLGLVGNQALEWNRYTASLGQAGVTLQQTKKDKLLWNGGDSSGEISVRNCYKAILSLLSLPNLQGWKLKLWKWNLQLKIILFFRLAVDESILTWDNLLKKGWVGPDFCYLCRAATEDNAHLFIHCHFTKATWNSCINFLHLNLEWKGQNLNDCMVNWTQNLAAPKKLPVLLCWFLWKERNKALFEGKLPSSSVVTLRTLNSLSYTQTKIRPRILRLSLIIPIHGYSLTFFDDASINGGTTCGAGGTLKIPNSPEVRWFFNCGDGSNTKAELVGAWATFIMENVLHLHHLHLLGDSKVIIEWLQRKGNYMPPKLKVGSAEFETCRKTSKEPTFNTFTGKQTKKLIVFPKEPSKFRRVFVFFSLGSMESKDLNKL